MSHQIRLTARDLELLGALLQKVRVFSLRQIASAWWKSDVANTRRRLNAVVKAGLLNRLNASARPMPAFSSSVASWQPGDAAPEFDSVSYALKRRWQQRPPRPTTVFIASQKAARLLGGKARGSLKSAIQTTHDLGVSAVWLRFREEQSAWAAAWRGEDVMACTRRGQKLPDAFIVDDQEQPQWVVEFGGAYGPERIRDFHTDCASRSLPYQIW